MALINWKILTNPQRRAMEQQIVIGIHKLSRTNEIIEGEYFEVHQENHQSKLWETEAGK